MASMASYNMPSVKNCDMASMLGKCELKCLQWLGYSLSLISNVSGRVGIFSASISSRHNTVGGYSTSTLPPMQGAMRIGEMY